MENKYVNFGLGMMNEEERRGLLHSGAIINLNGVDNINCDGYCVNVYKNDDPIKVFEGTKFQCDMEKDNIKRNKPEIKVEVRSYPKSYFEYISIKFPKPENFTS